MLTVRKNYRKVPYHNWTHGWTVAHAMFVFLRQTNIFQPLEVPPLGFSLISQKNIPSGRCPLHGLHLPRLGPSGQKQCLHEDNEHPTGVDLFDFRDGTPPFVSGDMGDPIPTITIPFPFSNQTVTILQQVVVEVL